MSSHHCEKIIDPYPHVIRLKAAEPGRLKCVVESRLTEVGVDITRQNEGSTQPLGEKKQSKAFEKLICFNLRCNCNVHSFLREITFTSGVLEKKSCLCVVTLNSPSYKTPVITG